MADAKGAQSHRAVSLLNALNCAAKLIARLLKTRLSGSNSLAV